MAKWDETCRRLDRLQVLSETDADLLEVYCLTYALGRTSYEKVLKAGPVSKGRRTAWAVEMHECWKHLERLIARFGLSPSDRAGLIVQQKETEDEFMKFMGERLTGTAN